MIALIVAAAVALTLDAGTKRLVVARLEEGRLYGARGSWGIRVARGRPRSRTAIPLRAAVPVWLALTAAAVALQPPTMAAAVGLGLALGGAAANLADRARDGAVLDFVTLGPWPAFNLADAAMVAGLGLVLLSLR